MPENKNLRFIQHSTVIQKIFKSFIANSAIRKFLPPDCVHAAIMKRYGIKEILSADKEFDKVPNIKRLDPLKWNPSK